MHHIGKNQSAIGRKEIELQYGLVQADKAEEDTAKRFKPIIVSRALYGRMETKKAMNSIINVVTDHYKFSSLAQFNAVLGLYNLAADTGAEGSRVNRHKGLVFRMLDAEGNKVGVPIKASDFASKPTLKHLALKYEKNEPLKAGNKNRVSNAVNIAFFNGVKSVDDLKTALQESGIDLVVRQSADGVVYGLTYVDHETKVVFNGSELGKAFSAKAMLERCNSRLAGEGKRQNGQRLKGGRQMGQGNAVEIRKFSRDFTGKGGLDAALSRFSDALLVDGEPMGGMDRELRRTKRKKKKKVRLSPG
jgi:hypothetical protein